MVVEAVDDGEAFDVGPEAHVKRIAVAAGRRSRWGCVG